MWILARYLTRLLLARLALFLFGGVAFVIGFDLLQNVEEILQSRDRNLLAVAHYVALRLPESASDVLKFACLLAGLFTLTHLSRHRELTAVWDAGVSHFGIVLRLLPAMLLLGGLQFWLDNWAVPASAASLRDWQVGESRAEQVQISHMAESAAWFRSGNDIVRVPREGASFGLLRDIVIFERNAEGALRARLDIEEARFRDGVWRLSGVSRRRVEDNAYSRVPDRDWAGPSPEVLTRLVTHPSHLGFVELGRLVSGEQQRYWAPHLYATWRQARLAGAFTPFVLLTLLVALTQRIQRLGHAEYLFVAGLGLGFAYFIFSGICLAMGEVGILPPLLAGWAPPAGFAALAGAIALWHEDAEAPVARPEPT